MGTAWKVSVFGVFLVRIFPHSDWIRRDTDVSLRIHPKCGKTRPKKYEYGHFSCSGGVVTRYREKEINWLVSIWKELWSLMDLKPFEKLFILYNQLGLWWFIGKILNIYGILLSRRNMLNSSFKLNNNACSLDLYRVFCNQERL